MTLLTVGRPTYPAPMTTVTPRPFEFGCAPTKNRDWGHDTTDADYEDPAVIAANLERGLAEARIRVAAELAALRRKR